jgi:hypothetical protein
MSRCQLQGMLLSGTRYHVGDQRRWLYHGERARHNASLSCVKLLPPTAGRLVAYWVAQCACE